MDDPHHILGLNPSATKEDIKKAYRRLAQEYHPDTGHRADEKRFAQITEAYHFLRSGQVYSPVPAQPKEEPVVPKSNLYTQRIDPQRKKQQEAFYRARLWEAIMKVIAFSLLFGSITYLFGKAMGSSLFFGFIGLFFGEAIQFFPCGGFALGLLFGILFNSKRFFELKTFLSPRQLFYHQLAYRITLILLALYLLIPIFFTFLPLE